MTKPASDKPHHWPRRTWTEASERDARLVLEGRAKRALDLLRELLPSQDVGRLKRLELALRVRTDRGHFTEVELGADANIRGLRTGCDGYFRPRRQISIRTDD